MIKIFFDPRRPELVFSLAVILKKIGDEINVIIPATPHLLLEEEKINKINGTLPVSIWDPANRLSVAEGESECFYLLGIGPSNQTEVGHIRTFLEHHGPEIGLWIDDHHDWSPDLLLYAAANSVAVKVHPAACLDKLRSLKYAVPVEWKAASLSFKEVSNNLQIESPLGRRYYLALKAGRIMAQNTSDGDYCYDENYLSVFWAVLKELQTGIIDHQLDSLQDLALLMMAETELAKQQISPDSRFFQEAKNMGRPVGFLELNNGMLDIQEVLDYGSKKYPWLCIIVYFMNGQSYLRASSSCLSIDHFLNYYSDAPVSREELYQLMNAEIVHRTVS